ncbi:aminodeoxychorismate synthase component I [Riemerella anatipestifer]|uniref:aminodeoxychorismate synthase component I n=1 Tax=Riemerella anatipestifer TaxID=34085 RepID=UPI000D69C379|nr:aminodeoxychorismate synthase component I [Riemerella anatipestifer]MBT0551705.1 aminodeoxychorismate synthase component I [Riemerella anatipestifer]MBT0553171.1 aminodeoxychorismate synthase component I [Riemerella anatipestifer]MCE3023866.1 aminodeoxychorismate synthase component I [Riemerella anatipestifer]MCU7541696.1 aminodeoxychorismate synthase component I [Riemerella anatipestifer]MCU7559481.1 aminodeoxychorismate synthase component I [Riemerella anatipestifer]
MFSTENQFALMDKLSLEGVPFLFIIDFMMTKIEVFTLENLEQSGLKVDFPNFKINSTPNIPKPHRYDWEVFPETKEEYLKGFRIVQKHLKKGNSYLTNYTRKTQIKTNLSLEDIFYFSNAKYKIFYSNQFVCFSPETFVEIKNNKIATHPMKGTIDASLENATEILKNDVKEKAEHYTVVDLLRNDLSQVADNVKVKDFQRIDFIKTQQRDLYAMSSEIEGMLKPQFRNKIGSLMQKLLPAGSILGAPKPKTKAIILEAEGYNRGFYTGVCGWFDGKNLDSCVMIRFIEKEGETLFFKSGGGITHLSNPDDEYQEMKNKIYVPIY